MEKENNKNRDDARKQYNQTVLRLVELCKLLDPRYDSAVKQLQEEMEKKEEEKRQREEEERKKREEEMKASMATSVTKVYFIIILINRLKILNVLFD